MPELPEVEVLANHLRPILVGRTIRHATLLRPKACRPHSPAQLTRALTDRRILQLNRRAKYLLFTLSGRSAGILPTRFLVHLGMTGRLFVQPARAAPPKHTAAILRLDRGHLVFQDPRAFGRFTLDCTALDRLGPEPLPDTFTVGEFSKSLAASRQPIKVRLLDQTVVAGLGNIYASESLFRARIHPALPTCHLQPAEIAALRRAIRAVLRQAIALGSTVPLNWSGSDTTDRLFYYGRDPSAPEHYEERLQVYGRTGLPCPRCRTAIERVLLGARSTFYCPACQPTRS